MRFYSIFYLFLFLLLSCSKNPSGESSNAADSETPRLLLGDTLDSGVEPDAYLIETTPPPPQPQPELTREERCAQTPIQETQAYCVCFPDCCDRQRWYCPPNPRQTIDVMQVILEVCDENKQRCEFGVDPDCPPPEIISQSECITQWECPPGTSGEFIRWW